MSPRPTWAVCRACLTRGPALGSDAVAGQHGHYALTTHVLLGHPAQVWLAGVGPQLWALCGCGWRRVGAVLAMWHDRKAAAV